MAYRGEDLDLRTPQGWGSAGREQPGSEQAGWASRGNAYQGGRGDPLWVDDTVLSCCNHAYELAVAHRASEVRIEHLLNALTLNAAAAQSLEATGIRDAALRRESSAIVAAEIPTNGNAPPKRSDALEQVLRQAAERAYPRRTAVTVDDLINTMLEINRDLPGLQLLRRHSAQWNRSNGTEPRGGVRLEPLPHLARTYGGEGRPDPSAWRGAKPPSEYFTTPPPPNYQRPGRDWERETGGSTVDSVQNNRIEALERAVRDLGLDLADDRKSLQSIVTDLQRNTTTQVDDTVRFRSGLSDRLGALEDSLRRVRDEPLQIPTVMMDHLSALERSLDARLDDMARNMQASSALIDRFTSIERSLDNKLTELGRIWSGIGDRLAALEAASRRPLPQQTLPAGVVEQLESLTGLDRKLKQVDALEDTFQLILDRMVGLERHLEGSARSDGTELGLMEARIEEMEDKILQKLGGDDELAPMVQRLAAIERAVENRAAETGRTVSFIGERLRAVDESFNTLRNQSTDRLVQLEKLLTAYSGDVKEAGTSHARDLSEVHEAIVKLNGNQQTLANSLEQWRLDNTGDLSVVSNRLKTMEEASHRREPVFEALARQLTAVHNVVAKREVHKSRFKQWLFGTDEWYSASYDTERWRAHQEAADQSKGLDFRTAAHSGQPTTIVRR